MGNKSILFVLNANYQVKVGKFQKQIFLFSFEPKNEQIFFWILP